MRQAKFFARALGVAVAVPMSGIIALSGVGASAASCPPGTSPVMQNGVAGCASTGSGGSNTPPAGDGSSTASPQPVTPVRTADPEDPSPTQPITPMTPTSDPNVPQPAPVIPTPIASALPPEPSPDGGRPNSNASASGTATPMPTESSSSAKKPGGTATGVPRELTVGGNGNSGGTTQESYPPALSEVKVEQVAPGAASEAEPFNPAGIFIAALSGLLAILVGLLFWVNKRHATKKAP